jgi:hypothetical protein
MTSNCAIDFSGTGIAVGADTARDIVVAADKLTELTKNASNVVVSNFLRTFRHPDVHCEVRPPPQ